MASGRFTLTGDFGLALAAPVGTEAIGMLWLEQANDGSLCAVEGRALVDGAPQGQSFYLPREEYMMLSNGKPVITLQADKMVVPVGYQWPCQFQNIDLSGAATVGLQFKKVGGSATAFIRWGL